MSFVKFQNHLFTPPLGDIKGLSLAHTLSWFMTKFESRGAHRCGEQWYARDKRVYTGSGLREDKNPKSYVCRCIMIRQDETPSTPPFRG
jgi:hypothetical protein